MKKTKLFLILSLLGCSVVFAQTKEAPKTKNKEEKTAKKDASAKADKGMVNIPVVDPKTGDVVGEKAVKNDGASKSTKKTK